MRSHVQLTTDERVWREGHIRDHAMAALAEPVRVGAAVPFTVHGFDKSSYQAVAADWRDGGRTFAIFKASEATTYSDPHFAGFRASAEAQGMVAKGLYDFARPGKNSPQAEFAHYMSVVGAPRPGEFAVLDYEVPPWDQAWACAWADMAKAAGFHRVVFYTYAGMLGANPTDQLAQHFTDLWVAGYGTRVPSGDRWKVGPTGWTFWQHTDGVATVPGNDGPFDCSVFYGSPADLATWIGAPAPQPGKDWDDMATKAEVQQAVTDAIKAEFEWYTGPITVLSTHGAPYVIPVLGGIVRAMADKPCGLTVSWVYGDGEVSAEQAITADRKPTDLAVPAPDPTHGPVYALRVLHDKTATPVSLAQYTHLVYE